MFVNLVKLQKVRSKAYTIPEHTLDCIHPEKGVTLNFKRMRYSKELVLKTLKLFFEYGLSTRQIPKIVKEQETLSQQTHLF